MKESLASIVIVVVLFLATFVRSTLGFGEALVLGGAYGMNGPPLVMYGALRGWSPQRFCATLQGYFLPASMLFDQEPGAR